MRALNLSRFRISTRIGLLVGLGLAGVGMIAGLQAYTGRQLEAIEAQAATARDLGAATADVEKAALELRRREKDFLLRHDLNYAAQYGKFAERILESLAAIGKMPAARSLGEDLRRLQAGFAGHRDQFVKVVQIHETLGLDENRGLQGALRKSVQAVEAKVREAEDHELLALMLTMRRHEKDFIMRTEPRYVEALAKTRGPFDTALAASKLANSAKGDAAKLMDAYQADFARLAEIQLRRGDEVKQLSKIFADMESSFDALVERSAALVAEAGQVHAAAKSEAAAVLWAAVAIIAVLLLGCSVIVALGIVRPLRGMVGAMLTVAKGDFDVAVPALGQKDEIGDLAGALDTFRANGIETRRLQAEQKEAEKRAEQEKRALMIRMADEFDKAVGGIVGAVSAAADELQAAAQTMSGTAEEASRQSAAVASAAEEASANVQTVATAAEELSSSVGEIGRQVNQSSSISAKAVEEADRTNATVQGLADAAQKIGEVVKLINDIAGQTNLLALNATIEAARAGEAGKGFAVVASEVKTLATQTAKATDEIAGQVSAIQGATTDSVRVITGVTGTIRQMNEIATSIASAVEEQGAATNEIARNVQQAAKGTEEVTSNIAGVSKAASEAGAASNQVLSAAQDLSQQSAKLRVEVDRFLSTVRAA